MSAENFKHSPGKRPITFCRGQTHWLSKAEFESVKASGMFGEFYPDQPDHWEDLPDRDPETEPRGTLMRALTDRAELGPYVEFLTLHPETQENAKARALQFLRGICSGESLFFIREDGQHEAWRRSELESWSRPAPITTTPRTDAFLKNCHCPNGKNVVDNFTKQDLAEFARDLERECDRLQSLIDADPHSRLAVYNMAIVRTNEAEAALAKLEGEAAEAKRVIGGVRHENERLRGVERTLRKQVAEFEKLFGLDTPWTAVSLYKSLVIAESKFREDGRDFDGWESIQAAAAVAQQRVSDFLKE